MQANEPTTVNIDEEGEIAHFRTAYEDREQTTALHIDGDEAASFRMDFGGKRADDGSVHFFEGSGYTYEDTQSVRDGWRQAEEFARLVVTSAATEGATADVLLSRASG